MIGPISAIGINTNPYYYNPLEIKGTDEANAATASTFMGKDVSNTPEVKLIGQDDKDDSKAVTKSEKSGECETCKNRKYVDGSDEMVSFKAPAKISSAAAPSMVRSHEQEHVNNAYEKASKNDGKVLQCSVAIKMGICPECGKAFIAGGTTTTKIRYGSDPYSQNQKSANYNATAGANVDLAV